MGRNPEICYNVPAIFNEREYYMDRIRDLGNSIWNFYENTTKTSNPSIDYLQHIFSNLEVKNIQLSVLSPDSMKQTKILLTNLIAQLSQVLSKKKVSELEITELQSVLRSNIVNGTLITTLQTRGRMFLNGHITEIIRIPTENITLALAKAIYTSEPQFYEEMTNFLKYVSEGETPLLRGNIAYNLIVYVKNHLSTFEKFEISHKVSKEAISAVIEKVKEGDLVISNKSELLAIASFYFTRHFNLINFPLIFNRSSYELISAVLLIQPPDFFINNITVEDSAIIELHCKPGIEFFNEEGQFTEYFDNIKNECVAIMNFKIVVQLLDIYNMLY